MLRRREVLSLVTGIYYTITHPYLGSMVGKDIIDEEDVITEGNRCKPILLELSLLSTAEVKNRRLQISMS